MKIAVLVALLSIFTGFLFQSDPYLSEGEKLVNITLSETAKIIKSKYKIQPSGLGAAMPGGPIQELTLCFTIKGPFSKERLRKLLVECAQEVVNQVNANTQLQQFLAKPPFTVKNVQIIIYNHDKNGRQTNDPEIATAEISRGVLAYSTNDPNDRYRYKSEIDETYEEALKILSIENSSNTIQMKTY